MALHPEAAHMPSSSRAPTPVILTPHDVDRLLVDPSEDSRLTVLEKVSGYYNEGQFAPREHEIAEQIFRLLMKDTVLKVRQTLAQQLQTNPTIPRDIILHLAHDVDHVALPILKNSEVLSDADLEEIVMSSQSMPKLLTISQREGVAPRVSEALIDTHYAEVIESLLANDSAEIAPRAFEKILDGFRGDPAVMEAVAHRKVLPITVVDLLVQKASDALANHLREKYKLHDAASHQEQTRLREEVFLRMLTADITEGELHALVAQMARDGRLTPSVVMSALCRGHLGFFTAAMARFANIPPMNAKRLLADRGDLGFHGLYQKSQLPSSMEHAMRIMLRAVQGLTEEADIPIVGSLLYANRLIERVLVLAGDEAVEYLPYCIALVRKHVAD